MKKILLGVLAVAGLVSCSNDEVLELNRSNDEIKFNLKVNNASRAGEIFNSGSTNIGDIYLWATYQGKTYINQDLYQYTETEEVYKYKNMSGTRYWPSDGGPLSFYAINCATAKHPNYHISWPFKVEEAVDGSLQLKDVFIHPSHNSQEDLLYAQITKERDGVKPVPLTFHHAFAQIVFNAKNINPKIHVEVSAVSVHNVSEEATFTFPEAKPELKGVWSDYKEFDNFYEVTLDNPVSLVGSKDANVVDLTSADYTKALLLLPQTTTAWVPTDGVPAKDQAGSYLMIDCKVYNVAGDEFDPENDVLLWPKEEGKKAAIPLAFNWEQGNRYIYTLVFNEVGYDPEKPEPALIPIEVSVAVDNFVDVPAEGEDDVKVDLTTDENK